MACGEREEKERPLKGRGEGIEKVETGLKWWRTNKLGFGFRRLGFWRPWRLGMAERENRRWKRRRVE